MASNKNNNLLSSEDKLNGSQIKGDNLSRNNSTTKLYREDSMSIL